MIDRTHDPELKSWVESANVPETDFAIQNLPYASFRRIGEERVSVGIAIGDQVLDATETFGIPSMQVLMAMPRTRRVELRQRISDFLGRYISGSERFLTRMSSAELLLPCSIGDYTDFYASIDHATNVGWMFRPENPLPPNYKWMPIGYHGRSSSIVVSGTPVRRPWGRTWRMPVPRRSMRPADSSTTNWKSERFSGPATRWVSRSRSGKRKIICLEFAC